MTLTTMPQLGLGTWQLEGDDATRAVRTAIDLGYRHIDTAQLYGNEALVGRGIAEAGVDRDDLWVTTKLSYRNLAYDDVVATTEQSVADLGTGVVDLLLIHWPTEIDTVEETLEAMQSVQDRELVRYLGVSNFTADQLRRASQTAELLTDQVEYHALLDQSAVRAAVAEIGAVLTAYSPLGRGAVLEQQAVRDIADARGVEPAQVALRWLLDQPDVVVIPKATSEAHLKANLAALELDPLSEEERARIDGLPKDRREIDPPFGPDWDPPAA